MSKIFCSGAVYAELGQDIEVKLAPERNDNIGEPLGRYPFPGVEFGMLGGEIDVRIIPGKAHGKPFLPLAAIPPTPYSTGEFGRQVVLKPALALAEEFRLVGADLLSELAQCGLERCLARVDPALRHLPSRHSRHIDASADEHL